jgi:hypothetical protein
VRTNGKEPELLEPIPYEFMAKKVQKKKKTPDYKNLNK